MNDQGDDVVGGLPPGLLAERVVELVQPLQETEDSLLESHRWNNSSGADGVGIH